MIKNLINIFLLIGIVTLATGCVKQLPETYPLTFDELGSSLGTPLNNASYRLEIDSFSDDSLDKKRIKYLEAYCQDKNAMWQQNSINNEYRYACISNSNKNINFLLTCDKFDMKKKKSFRILTNSSLAWNKSNLKEEAERGKQEKLKQLAEKSFKHNEKLRLERESLELEHQAQKEKQINEHAKRLRSRMGQKTMTFFDNWRFNGDELLCRTECQNKNLMNSGYVSLQHSLNDGWQFISKINEVRFNPTPNCECIGAHILLKK